MSANPQKLRTLPRNERLAWLRLWRSDRVGPITFDHLLRQFGTAERAVAQLPEHARNAGLKHAGACTRAAAERELDAVERLGGRIVAMPEQDYPPMLRRVANAPRMLTILGNAHVLRRPTVAIVGARNASSNGLSQARRLAGELSDAGYLVASGLARGIDTAAHRGALTGGTAAVVAGGADVIYPPENEALHAQIIDMGAVIAEMPVGLKPQGRHFPRRNKIIAGMAVGTVVVEAATRSGSLITAKDAVEIGREVFAVPGSPLDPRSDGANDLIRNGATLARNAADILEVLAPMSENGLNDNARDLLSDPVDALLPPSDDAVFARAVDPSALADVRKTVASLLSPSPTPVDELIRDCQFSAAEVHTVLSEMELAGRAELLAGARVMLIKEPDVF
ncbi:DNA-processing protein DprA [Fodinicurvata sp. EGI_FJ10296]|uniref:DNA-processing protein DprA n=1 Tax=Fodinicurvata sp. EGI_FJ10296 TaxID=3231908 RepID=UPI0034543F6B